MDFERECPHKNVVPTRSDPTVGECADCGEFGFELGEDLWAIHDNEAGAPGDWRRRTGGLDASEQAAGPARQSLGGGVVGPSPSLVVFAGCLWVLIPPLLIFGLVMWLPWAREPSAAPSWEDCLTECDGRGVLLYWREAGRCECGASCDDRCRETAQVCADGGGVFTSSGTCIGSPPVCNGKCLINL